MDNGVQNSLQSEQWFSMFEKGDKRPSSIGNGALRFIRTRSSIRRDLKKHCNRSKSGGLYENNVEKNGGGGGIGKWLRDHLGGGSKESNDINSSLPFKTNLNPVNVSYEEKDCSRATICTSQNLYCSLPRDGRTDGRHNCNHIVMRKIPHGNYSKSRSQDRSRSSGSNYHEKFIGIDYVNGGLTRGGPIYSSEGKSLKKRNRDRRRHSLNELHVHDRQRCRRKEEEEDEEKENEDEDEETNSTKNREKEKGEKRKDNDIEENKIYLTWDESSIFRDEEEYEFEKKEESITIPRVSPPTMEKSKEDGKVEEVRDSVEPDYVLAEIPAEVLDDREATIDMMKGLISEMRLLRRRNKLLERRVYQHFQKIQQKVTASEIESKTSEEIEKIYETALEAYKLQIDEAIAKEIQFLFEIENYKDKVQNMKDEDERLFKELLAREKEIAVGLVYVKTGESISEKVVDVIANRQTVRRKVLARDRFENIALQHHFDRIDKLLQNLEVLGEGMTTMDYEALRMANVNHVDKLDERVRDLEKLRTLLAEMVIALAHLKEKEVCVVEDMERERNKLTKSREDTTKVREQLNHFLVLLRNLREEYNNKRKEAGMLGVQPILREMDKATRLRNNLINDIERMKSELEKYRLATEKKKKTASNLSSRTKYSNSSCLNSFFI